MRVGANARQYARIKKMHAEGTPAKIIAATIQITDQSLEKILAHLDGRDEVVLALEDSPVVAELRLQNADLLARLAKFEDPQSGETKISTDGDESDEEAAQDGQEASQEAVQETESKAV